MPQKKLQLTSSEFRTPFEVEAGVTLNHAQLILGVVEIVFGQVAPGRSCDLGP